MTIVRVRFTVGSEAQIAHFVARRAAAGRRLGAGRFIFAVGSTGHQTSVARPEKRGPLCTGRQVDGLPRVHPVGGAGQGGQRAAESGQTGDQGQEWEAFVAVQPAATSCCSPV